MALGLTFEYGALRRNPLTSILQAVDVGADLEGRAQLDVHGRHEMLLLQEQQGLSIDFLRQELGGQVLAACKAVRSRWTDGKSQRREQRLLTQLGGPGFFYSRNPPTLQRGDKM